MMLRSAVLLLFVLTNASCAARTASEPNVAGNGTSNGASLTVSVLGLESEQGEVAVAVYDSAESFKERTDAVAKGRIAPGSGKATWTAESIEPGLYAVAVYHDLNENGKLDRSALGAPTEPYGFSNDARGRFGPPKFEKAAIRIDPGGLTIEITLR
jgi:uncharacterized protein (DUF2141 family)